MEIHVSGKKLRAALENEADRKRRYGANMAKKIALRLDALRAADSLVDFWPPNSGPERCHELKGNLAGVFSIDLQQPYRLLFKPIEASPPTNRSDERQRWTAVTSVEIVAIEDTHG